MALSARAYRKIAVTVITFVTVIVLVYLALNDPTSAPAPQCLFHTLTGYDCPGCGSQRAINALFHGDIRAAWSYNAALFFSVPVIVLYAASPRRLERFLYSPFTLYALAAAIALWWILRNL